MNAITLQNKLVKLIAKYGRETDIKIVPKSGSTFGSFELVDNTEDSGWIELQQD